MKRLFILFLITLFIGPSLFAGKGGADYNPDGFEISPEAYPANIPPGDEGLQAAYDADKTVLSWTHTLYGGYTLTNEFINNQYYTIAGDEYQKYVISYRIEEMKENGYVFETNATDDNLDNDPVVLAQYTVSELAGVNERIEYHLTAAHFNWDDDENIYQYKITGSIAVIHTIKLKQNRTDNIFDITRTIGVALPITDSYVFREKTPAIHNVSYDYNNEPYWDQNASQDWFGPNSSNDLGFQVKVPEDDPTYYLYNLLIYSDNPNPTPTDPPPEEPTPTITSVNKNLNYISRPT
ncbi:MAG: hypothetical protein JW969_08490, partial [Spirochaetales bacterium]|nr:hypothetical protein [Spirochaetales bacterium]